MPNKITMGLSLLDFGNHVLYSKRFDISQYKTMAEVLAFAHDTYVEIAKLESIKDRCCTGVGVAISGVFDKSKGILIYTTNSNWESAPIRNLVEELFGLPCHVDTRANYCALAMRRMRPEAENLVYLYLDTEVNSGVICDGHLLRGENGHSMRIAHLPLGNPAHRCTLQACGCYGCINTEISVTGMVGDYHDYDASTPMLNRWCQLTQEIQVDPAAFAPYLKEKGTYIGTLVATLVSTFDPEILYLGGRCTEIFPYLEPNITAEVTRRCKLATQFGVQIAWDPNFNATLNEGIIQMIYDRWTPLSPVNPPLSVL